MHKELCLKWASCLVTSTPGQGDEQVPVASLILFPALPGCQQLLHLLHLLYLTKDPRGEIMLSRSGRQAAAPG